MPFGMHKAPTGLDQSLSLRVEPAIWLLFNAQLLLPLAQHSPVLLIAEYDMSFHHASACKGQSVEDAVALPAVVRSAGTLWRLLLKCGVLAGGGRCT